MRLRTETRRSGTILPLVAISLVALVGFVALAVDIGVLMVARTQCQNAADAAALAGARQLTGIPPDYNKDEAAPAAAAVLKNNSVLTVPIDPPNHDEITTEIHVGSYRYDTTTDNFVIDPDSKTDSDAWSLVRCVVSYEGDNMFANVFSLLDGPSDPIPLKVSAVATAAHRPRDVAVVVDLSGSMRLGTLLGGPITNTGGSALTNRTRAMNSETVYPSWGHYSSSLATWRGTTSGGDMTSASGETMSWASNFVLDTANGTALVKDFFQDGTAFGASQLAFTPWSDGFAGTPGGDNFKRVNNAGTGSYAINVNEVLNRSATDNSTTLATTKFIDDQSGSSTTAGYGAGFAGYTAGPRYWGKTFWVWPPDPRGPTNLTNNGVNANNGAKDWRQRFFVKVYLGTRNVSSTGTTSSTTSSGGSSSSSSSSTSGTGSSSSTSGSTGSPPPPLSIRPVPELASRRPASPAPRPQTPPADLPSPSEVVYYYANPTVGTRTPCDNDAILFAGPSDFTSTASTTASGTGDHRVPGEIVEFTTQRTVVGTLTTELRHRFTHQVNYDAILSWIKNSGTNPFPPRLRAGGILYYNSIPDTIPTNIHPVGAATQLGRDQRFWKEYIDEVLGIEQYGYSTTNTVTYARYNDRSGRMGYKDIYEWKPGTTGAGIYPSAEGLRDLVPGPDSKFTDDQRFLNYRDNPRRPSLQYWFGPMTMVDFISNMNLGVRSWLPGTAHDAPMWMCKAGVQAAIEDIKKNHPNDMISVIAFSKPAGYGPTSTTNPTSTFYSGQYNTVRSPLGRDYNRMVNSLYFPPKVVQTGAEIHPYDTNAMNELPKSVGGTCYPMGFMLAYNQFARPTDDGTLRTFATGTNPVGQAGGLGRRGAQKMVIFETDGVCSTYLYPDGGMDSMFQSGGPYNSYFKVRYDQAGSSANEYPNYVWGDKPIARAQTEEVAQRLCNPDDDAAAPGFSMPRKPVRIHCIAFGTLFEGTTQDKTDALALLGKLQYMGGSQDVDGALTDTDKIIVGNSSTVLIDKMQKAFSKIMQDGYSITLIE